MLPSKLPTDNAYKFFCVLSLVLTVGCFLAYWTLGTTLAHKAATFANHGSEFQRKWRELELQMILDNRDVTREIEDAHEQMSSMLSRMELSDEDMVLLQESLMVSFRPVISWRNRQDEQLIVLQEFMETIQRRSQEGTRLQSAMLLLFVMGILFLAAFVIFSIMWLIRTQRYQDASLRK